MGIIDQTNRTILFDAVNPEVFDLFNIMSDVDENSKSLTDEKVKEINDALLVKSFDDFLSKFKPTIYSYFDEERGMVYELLKPAGVPDSLVKKIVIDRSNNFLKMFIGIMDKKRATGSSNVDFNYEKVTEMLAPHKVLNEIKKIKKDISFLEMKNAELESDSPAKEDAVRKLATKLESAKKYHGETASQLTLMLGMIRENLDTIAEASKKGITDFKPALPVFSGEKAEILALNAPKSPNLLLSGKNQELLAGDTEGADTKAAEGGETALAETAKAEIAVASGAIGVVEKKPKIDYQNLSISILENQYDEGMHSLYASAGQEYDKNAPSLAKELVIAAFTDKVSETLMEMSTDEKLEMYNKYSNMNTTWQKAFIRTAKLLVEKILSVKTFFDQYQPKSRQMQPTLLVVNAHISSIVEERNLESLRKYLETVNNKSDFRNTIWFGIVPNIKYSEESDIFMDEDTMRDFGYTGDIDKGTTVAPTEMSDLQLLLDGIQDFRIQTFFAFEANEDTTFLKLSTQGIDEYISKTEELANNSYSRYAIPCLPNFTVIPSNKSRVVLGSKVIAKPDGGIEFSQDRDDFMKFWIYGVYVSAAYVAAGLVAAYQCPSFLETKFKSRVKRDYPGVRFDIEAGENALVVPTTLAKEISGYTTETKNIINSRKFGFVFSSDNSQLDGNTINLITVYKARCMHENKDGGYESIFREVTRSYLYRMIGAITNDYKREGIDKIFDSGGKVKEWQLSPNYANSILRDGDGIEKGDCDGTTYNIEIKFAGVSENMELLINTD